MDDMLREAKRIEEYMIQFRRDLHENPELSGEEYRTQGKIMEQLDLLGIPYEKAGTTSLIARLKGSKPGRTIALRADMDGLPIEEETDVPFRSRVRGLMHACGHDSHTAMLLGAARILSERRDSIRGGIRFFFQEGEETFSGARKIIEAGGMEGVDACFGMHGMPGLETGFVDISPGYRMAGCDIITVRFEGVSGHGSAPHLAKDTIHPACLFVTDLQGIITKSIDVQEPVVLSVGRFSGGTKANIVAKYTELEISMRYFDLKARETVHHAIRRHAQGIGDAYEIKAEVTIEEGPPSLYNDEALCRLAGSSCTKIFGPGRNQPIKRLMGSEDMPFYFSHAPGIYAFLGYRNEEKEAIYFPHHERFNFDEDALKFGAALFAQFALDFSEENDMHIQHIALMVRDIEKSIKFYETMTELKVDRRIKAGPGEIAFLTNGSNETEIELICMPQGQKFKGQGLFICFKTDKLDEMHKLATEKSLSPSPIQVPGDGTRYFYVYDPDGVSVQLRVFGE